MVKHGALSKSHVYQLLRSEDASAAPPSHSWRLAIQGSEEVVSGGNKFDGIR
jgi:hypothetical protein